MSVTPPLFLALFVLMGIAPLSAWGVVAVRRIGQGLIVPGILSLATLLIFVQMGQTSVGALIGYWFVALAGWVAVNETFRAVRARMKNLKENPLSALIALATRNPRRYGGYLIHAGVAVIGVGIIGSTLFQQETQATLRVGDEMSLSDYTLRYDEFLGGQVSEDGRIMDIAVVTVIRNGTEVATLRPRRDFFPQQEGMNSMTIAAAHSTLENDVYLLLIDWDEISQNSATFKMYINPLINLVWWGSLILILGTLIAVYPHTVVSSVERPVSVAVGSRLAKGNR